jgi:hypothetical protein
MTSLLKITRRTSPFEIFSLRHKKVTPFIFTKGLRILRKPLNKELVNLLCSGREKKLFTLEKKLYWLIRKKKMLKLWRRPAHLFTRPLMLRDCVIIDRKRRRVISGVRRLLHVTGPCLFMKQVEDDVDQHLAKSCEKISQSRK